MVPRPVSPPHGVWVMPQLYSSALASVKHARILRMGVTERIKANRAERTEYAEQIARLDAELVTLVNEGLAGGVTAAELAATAGVSRARIYQIRDGKR